MQSKKKSAMQAADTRQGKQGGKRLAEKTENPSSAGRVGKILLRIGAVVLRLVLAVAATVLIGLNMICSDKNPAAQLTRLAVMP